MATKLRKIDRIGKGTKGRDRAEKRTVNCRKILLYSPAHNVFEWHIPTMAWHILLLLGWGLTSLHNGSYRDRETKENVRGTEKEAERGKRQEQDSDNLKINKTKTVKKPLICVWSLAYNLSYLSGPIRNMKVPADLA